ncbi:choice-of-anchor R domain-containing protein [Rubritalea tangerina]|uniref:Choice-of-anchor R domain-containing protein n=1 Tax=Rubritalea tangerina TaxID=430798 RepID=A0ABW4Z8P6_9BACT
MSLKYSLPIFLSLQALSYGAVVLSNLDDLPDRIESTSITVSPLNWQATPITTDNASYQINSITANIGDFNPAGTLFMEIWSVDGFAEPNANLQRLNLVQDFNGAKEWTGNLILSANTSYFVVVGVDNGGGQWRNFININDPVTPTFGDFRVDQGSWLLETDFMGSPIIQSYSSGSQGSSWSSDGLTGAPLRLEIDATVIPEPHSSTLIALPALLTLMRRSRQ